MAINDVAEKKVYRYHTGWLKKSKLLYCVNSLLFLSHPVYVGDILREFLGHNSVSGLRTLKPRKPKNFF